MTWPRNNWTGIVGICLSALYVYLQIEVWKKHGDDVTMQALGIVGTVGLWLFLLVAIGRYWKDARRAEATKMLLASEKHERKIQVENLERQLKDQAQNYESLVENLRSRIMELEDQGRIKAEVLYEESVCWLRKVDRREGPFCPTCHDNNEGKLIYLTPGATRGTFECGVCGNSFRTAEYKTLFLGSIRPARGPQGWMG